MRSTSAAGRAPLTAELVAVLGPENVCACDPSPPFAEACRARNPGVRVELAPAEALPFDDDAFDAALAQLVVNFMRDADAGLAQMRRVTRPGGVVAAAVWDYGAGMTLLRTFWDAAGALDSCAPDEDGMAYATADELHALWTRAGLTDVAAGEVVVAASLHGLRGSVGAAGGGRRPRGRVRRVARRRGPRRVEGGVPAAPRRG